MAEELQALYNEREHVFRRWNNLYSLGDLRTWIQTILQSSNIESVLQSIREAPESYQLQLTHTLRRIRLDIRFNQTFTITYGDQAENHAGMQKLGTLSSHGFSLENLQQAQVWFTQRGISTEIYNIHELLQIPVDPAYILVARYGLSAIVDPNAYYNEQQVLEKDTKAYMRGRVVNKHARHNLCFSSVGQQANFEQKMGTIIPFNEVPLLDQVRQTLPQIAGSPANNLVAEGNYYYDISNCGIGYHGDGERRVVVGVRMGASLPLIYQWYHRSERLGNKLELVLHHGDIYFMSDKAVGYDWKCSSKYTLRHAAGCSKYTA